MLHRGVLCFALWLSPFAATIFAQPSDNNAKQGNARAATAVQVGKFDELANSSLGGFAIDSLPHELSSIAIDKQGIIWIGSKYSGVVRYDEHDIRLFDAMNTKLPDEGIQSIAVDANDATWFLSTRGYVYSFDSRRPEGRRWLVPHRPSEDEARQIRTMAKKPDGSLYFPREDGGLYVVQEGALVPEPPATTDAQGQVRTIAFDSAGAMWAATEKNVYRCQSGDRRVVTLNSARKDLMTGEQIGPPIHDIFCSADKNTYLAGDSGVYRYDGTQAELWTPASHGLLAPRANFLWTNSKGEFLLGYGVQRGLSSFDGSKFKHWGKGTPTEKIWITAAAKDDHDRIWVVTRQDGLFRFDGNDWQQMVRPMAEQQGKLFMRRLPWRNRNLKDLVAEQAVEVKVDEVLTKPQDFVGKKIKIVGSIASSFEYAEVKDADDNRLGIWPDEHPELSRFLEAKGWTGKLKKVKKHEYSGYLETGSYFGHMGGAKHQLFIVEDYPAESETLDGTIGKEAVEKAFKSYLADTLHDAPIPDLPDSDSIRRTRGQLQGRWRSVGDPDSAILFEWDRISWIHATGESYCTFRVDHDRTIPAIDFVGASQFADTEIGIYELRGDTLRLRFVPLGNPDERGKRPRDFVAGNESKPPVLSFRRDPTYQVSLDRELYVADPPELQEELKKLRATVSLDGFGRIRGVHFGGMQPAISVDDSHLAILAKLPHLRRLSCSWSPHVSDRGLGLIAQHAALEGLSVGDLVTDEGLKQLTALPNLRSLTVYGNSVRGAFLQQLNSWPKLRSLGISETSVTDESLQHLRLAPELRTVSLPRKITDAGVRHLKTLNQLERIDLPSAVTDEGLRSLDLPSKSRLKSLFVGGQGITDAGLKDIESLPKLNVLGIHNTRMTSEELGRIVDHCQQLSTLQLKLNNEKLSQAEVERLAKLKQLQFLSINQSAISDAQVAMLKQKLPATQFNITPD